MFYSCNTGNSMARMKPVVFDYSESKSRGEERVFNSLRDNLDNKWLVCHSWRWLPHSSNQRTWKDQGEGDFVLFHPECGIIVIEVKGGTIEYRDDGRYYSNYKLIKNPEKQASDTKFDIVERLKEKRINRDCYVGHCVWFPDINWDINYPPNLNSKTLFDQSDLNNPEIKLRKIISSRKKPALNPKKIKDIENVLHRPFIMVKNLRFRIIDTVHEQIRLTQEQQRAFEYLEDNNCLGVKGRAGTGKTLLAVNRAIQLTKGNEKILFVCYNRGLADYLSNEINNESVDVFTYHSYAKNYLESYYPWRIVEDENQEIIDTAFFNYIGNELSEVVDENKDQYTACIIDEAQDLKENWFVALKNTFFPNFKFYFFFDPLQVPYSRKIELNESHFDFGSSIIPLKKNMRNTKQVSQSSLNIIGAQYNTQQHFSSLEGDYPIIKLCNNNNLMQEVRKTIIHLTVAEHIENKNITILTMGRGRKSLDSSEIMNIEVISFRKFKGLDNQVILITEIDFRHFEDEVYTRELYMAVTRSKYLVYLFVNNSDNLMKKSFCERLNISEVTVKDIQSYIRENRYE